LAGKALSRLFHFSERKDRMLLMPTPEPPQKQPNSARLSIVGWVGIILSAGFMWWFLRDVQAAALGQSFQAVSIPFVGLSACVLLSEFWIRAARWRILLQPIAPVRFGDLLRATLVGAAGNTLLPMRAGDLAKAAVATGATGLRLTTVLATNIMERVYDLFGLVAILLLTFLLLPDGLASSPEDLHRIERLAFYGKGIGVVALGGMSVFFAMARNPDKAFAFVRFCSAPVPGPVRERIRDLASAFIQGLAATQSARRMWAAIGLSLILWFNLSLAVYLLFLAFHFPLPYAAACFITVAIALAVVIPQAPGYLGVFQNVIEVTLALWTSAELFQHSGNTILSQDIKAFAIVFWGVSFVPVTVLGLWSLRKAGLSLGQIWSQRHNPIEHK
jgi:uncharacterized protein (TIRG00374 family)